MGRIRCAVFVTLSSKHRHYDKPCDYGKSGQYCKSQSVGRCRTGRFRITQPLISLWRVPNSDRDGPGRRVSQRRTFESRISGKADRGSTILKPGGVFPHPTCAKHVPCRHCRWAFNKTAASAAMTKSDSAKNNASTYHDASICSLKRGRKLVSFFLCRMPPILLPRFCRNASSCSTVRWAQLCSASA